VLGAHFTRQSVAYSAQTVGTGSLLLYIFVLSGTTWRERKTSDTCLNSKKLPTRSLKHASTVPDISRKGGAVCQYFLLHLNISFFGPIHSRLSASRPAWFWIGLGMLSPGWVEGRRIATELVCPYFWSMPMRHHLSCICVLRAINGPPHDPELLFP
jgi:hypothetical protein